MLGNTKLRLCVVATAAAVALAFGAVSPAYADPSSPKEVNGTGSDTTQDVLNGLAGLAVTNGAIGNFEATGSANITVNGVTFPRPVGSTAGVKALSKSLQGTAFSTVTLPVGTLQFARSSALRTDAGSQLTYIPFAGDAVTVAMSASSDFPKNVALGAAGQASTLFTLRNIYLGTVTTFTNTNFGSVTIRPLLPLTTSGTRSFWLGSLGVDEAQVAAGGKATDLGNTVIEHDGTFVTTAGDIVPFSISQYIAQGNHKQLGDTIVERRGNIVLGSIDGFKPVVFSGGAVKANPSFPVSRDVYNVVETAALTRLNPTATDLAIRATFDGPTSTVCQGVSAAAIAPYGFRVIPNCGDTSAQRGYVN